MANYWCVLSKIKYANVRGVAELISICRPANRLYGDVRYICRSDARAECWFSVGPRKTCLGPALLIVAGNMGQTSGRAEAGMQNSAIASPPPLICLHMIR
eukprot:scaffold2695_cov17-Prasinocladus_malaysianus.AAC.1